MSTPETPKIPSVYVTNENTLNTVYESSAPSPESFPAKRRPRRQRRKVGEVVTRQAAHPLAVQEALKLAGGDASRLEFPGDGSVIVKND